MGEDRSKWASADPERMASVVNEFRQREENGASDEELAVWLKFQTTSFGDGADVLSKARGISYGGAMGVLWRTSVWRNAGSRFKIFLPSGATTELRSPNGRTFSVGETLNMPHVPEPPHEAEAGRGTVWRVTAVEPDDDLAFTACLRVEPVRRLDARR
jgi:hypothetical protein